MLGVISTLTIDFVSTGFYNDHHFHYGYHIYSAAVVAKYDPQWALDNFEKILLFVRSFANPSRDDYVFPVFRHKDWYQGSSWASGIHLPPVSTKCLFEPKYYVSRAAISHHFYVSMYVSTVPEWKEPRIIK